MYTSLRNIFEDCSHASKDFPILSIEFKEEEVKGFYRIYIQFQDLECYVISCQESGLEAAEKQICTEYQAEVDLQMKALIRHASIVSNYSFSPNHFLLKTTE